MANLASQVILHPTASATLKVLGTAVGRDKVRSLHVYVSHVAATYQSGNHRSTGRHNTLHASLRGISFQEAIKLMPFAGML